MEKRDSYKLILRQKEFLIPSSFCLLTDVNPEIYTKLINEGNYQVKSYANDNTFQSFIDHWVYQQMPIIDDSNIDEFIDLSNEFDRLKAIINTYKNNQTDENTMNRFMLSRKQQIEQKKQTQTDLYQKVLSFIIDKDLSKYIISCEQTRETYKLIDACENGDFKFIDSLTRKIVIFDKIEYVIFEEDKTASLFRVNYDVFGDIKIPRSIKYNNEDYIVTNILRKSFWLSNVWTIEFPENSEVIQFDDEAFFNCGLKIIKIPCSLKRIGKKAFYYSNTFHSIEFPENSELETIDIEAFTHTDIKSIRIPRHLKCLETAVFNCCQNFTTIEFQENSELKEICPLAFISCPLESIRIPKSVTKISDRAFFKCFDLKNVEIPVDSELRTIGTQAFICTKINTLFIPEKVERLINGWSHGTSEMNNVVVSPENKNYRVINDLLVARKSCPKSDVFDVVCFVRRDVSEVKIPASFVEIASFAFSCCEKLKKVVFEENSQLRKIGDFAFFLTGIESILIPMHVSELSAGVFVKCDNLKLIEIAENSEIKLIDKSSFDKDKVEVLVPSNHRYQITFIEPEEKK